jgi:xylulokinase
VCAIDAHVRALYPAILYNDQRSTRQVAALERLVARDEFEALTGNTLVPGTSAITSMLWLREHEPEAWRTARWVVPANAYMNARLTGVVATDPSHVSVSGLCDIRQPGAWHAPLCEKLGIDTRLLPRIAGAAEVVGTVTRDAHERSGLREGVPIVTGSGDTPAAVFGAGARGGGTAVYTSGSSDCLSIVLSQPGGLRSWVNTAYLPPNTWLGIGTVTSACASVDWFAREVIGGGPAETAALAATSPLGAGGLLFLPYLQGERTPHWDPRARGAFFGITAATTRADMARAVFEGTAFALAQVFDSLEDVTTEPVREIRAAGGGTKNALWNQIKADVLGRALHILEFQDTGTFGAALLAGIGGGVYASFEKAAAVAERVMRCAVVRPNEEWTRAYERPRRLFAELYAASKDVMHDLAGAGRAP